MYATDVFHPKLEKNDKTINIVILVVLVRFLQSRTVNVVHAFIFTHLDYFLLSFLGSTLRVKRFILVDFKGK